MNSQIRLKVIDELESHISTHHSATLKNWISHTSALCALFFLPPPLCAPCHKFGKRSLRSASPQGSLLNPIKICGGDTVYFTSLASPCLASGTGGEGRGGGGGGGSDRSWWSGDVGVRGTIWHRHTLMRRHWLKRNADTIVIGSWPERWILPSHQPA